MFKLSIIMLPYGISLDNMYQQHWWWIWKADFNKLLWFQNLRSDSKSLLLCDLVMIISTAWALRLWELYCYWACSTDSSDNVLTASSSDMLTIYYNILSSIKACSWNYLIQHSYSSLYTEMQRHIKKINYFDYLLKFKPYHI